MAKQTALERLQERTANIQRRVAEGYRWGLPPFLEELQSIVLRLETLSRNYEAFTRIPADLPGNREAVASPTPLILESIAKAVSMAYSWRKRGGHHSILPHVVNGLALVDVYNYSYHRELRTLLLALAYLAGNRPEHTRLLLGLPHKTEVIDNLPLPIWHSLNVAAFLTPPNVQVA